MSEAQRWTEFAPVELVIPTAGGGFPLVELTAELATFRAYYTIAADHLTDDLLSYVPFERPLDLAGWLAVRSSTSIQRLPLEAIMAMGAAPISDRFDLEVLDLRRENPVVMIMAGVVVALAAATILSGGEIQANKEGFRAKLPPIGYGIEKLREALRPKPINQGKRTTYGDADEAHDENARPSERGFFKED